MMNIELQGTISGKKGRPTLDWHNKLRNGEMKKVPFMRFDMFCEDMTRRPEKDDNSGRMSRKKKPIQVILPEHKIKLFDHLEPGRRVLVTGRFTNDMNIKSKEEGYTNDKCYMSDLVFLDSPRIKQIERALNDMTAAGLITEDQAKSHLNAMSEHYSNMVVEHGPPRIVNDHTTDLDESNPDSPGF